MLQSCVSVTQVPEPTQPDTRCLIQETIPAPTLLEIAASPAIAGPGDSVTVMGFGSSDPRLVDMDLVLSQAEAELARFPIDPTDFSFSWVVPATRYALGPIEARLVPKNLPECVSTSASAFLPLPGVTLCPGQPLEIGDIQSDCLADGAELNLLPADWDVAVSHRWNDGDWQPGTSAAAPDQLPNVEVAEGNGFVAPPSGTMPIQLSVAAGCQPRQWVFEIEFEQVELDAMTLTLISPTGRRVPIWLRHDGPMEQLTLRDDALLRPEPTKPNPASTEYQPTFPLWPLIQEPVAGVWTLELSNISSTETIEVAGWRLQKICENNANTAEISFQVVADTVCPWDPWLITETLDATLSPAFNLDYAGFTACDPTVDVVFTGQSLSVGFESSHDGTSWHAVSPAPTCIDETNQTRCTLSGAILSLNPKRLFRAAITSGNACEAPPQIVYVSPELEPEPMVISAAPATVASSAQGASDEENAAVMGVHDAWVPKAQCPASGWTRDFLFKSLNESERWSDWTWEGVPEGTGLTACGAPHSTDLAAWRLYERRLRVTSPVNATLNWTPSVGSSDNVHWILFPSEQALSRLPPADGSATLEADALVHLQSCQGIDAFGCGTDMLSAALSLSPGCYILRKIVVDVDANKELFWPGVLTLN